MSRLAVRTSLSLRAGLVLLCLVGQSAVAQQAPEGVVRGLTIDLLNDGAPAAVVVTENGQRREVTLLEPLTEPWRVVIWAEVGSIGAERLKRAADTVQGFASELTSLGKTRLIVADGLARTWLDPTSDSQELSEVLRELAEYEPRARAFSGDRGEAWRAQLLVGELAELRGEGPRLLVLIGDPGGGASNGAHRALGPTLAAMGWVVFPVPGREGGEGGEGGVAQELASASGATVVGSTEDGRRVLQRLAERQWLEYRGAANGDALRRLEVTVAGSDRAATAAAWAGDSTFVSLARAERFLRLGEEGDLAIFTGIELLSEEPGGRVALRVEVLTELADMKPTGRRSSSSLRVSLVLLRADGPAVVIHRRGQGLDLSRSRRWLLEAALEAPEDLGEIIVVVEDFEADRWGATAIDEENSSVGFPGADTTVEIVDLRPSRSPGAVSSAVAEGGADSLIHLLPLTSGQATGVQLFRTLTLNSFLESAHFFLDGKKVAEDGREPFSARIDLGSEVRRHTVEVVAFDRLNRELGRDSLEVNPSIAAFRVSIERADLQPSDELEVVAAVTVPNGSRLERVEMYWNEDRRATLAESPFQARLAAAPSGTGVDFLRVVAVLDDGRTVEDVRLFSVGVDIEEVDVNLVEIFAVVTDQNGDPIRELEAEDFEIRLRGRSIPVERFGLAEEVPLALGLVIDTSMSMNALIQDTKAAALGFLTDLLTPRDKAFVVDFDSRPRLATGMTQDLPVLYRALATLEAGGFTALYDAIVFAALQFEQGQGRRALVLLTDGDDYRSRFSDRRAVQQARAGAIPVYIISLAALDLFRPAVRKTELEHVAKQTGGRVFYVESRRDLAPTYAKIGRELRSQYVLAFSSDAALTDKDLERIEVRVRRPKSTVRAVVAGRSVQ